MEEEQEKLFLDALANRVWKARTEGAIMGAAFVLGIGSLLYLVADAGPLNPISVFLYSAIRLRRKETRRMRQRQVGRPCCLPALGAKRNYLLLNLMSALEQDIDAGHQL